MLDVTSRIFQLLNDLSCRALSKDFDLAGLWRLEFFVGRRQLFVSVECDVQL